MRRLDPEPSVLPPVGEQFQGKLVPTCRAFFFFPVVQHCCVSFKSPHHLAFSGPLTSPRLPEAGSWSSDGWESDPRGLVLRLASKGEGCR